MWHSRTWFSRHGGVGLILEVFSHLNDSMIHSAEEDTLTLLVSLLVHSHHLCEAGDKDTRLQPLKPVTALKT